MDALSFNRNRKYSTEQIAQIQRVVGTEPTGEWDDATVAGVHDFQAEQNLDADGRVGPGTLAAIQAADARDDDDDYDHDDEPEREHAMTSPEAAAGSKDAPHRDLSQWCSANAFELIDFRDLQQWPRRKTYTKDYGYPRNKSRADPPKRGIRRDWQGITTLMLHTTGVSGMTAKRGVGIPCHMFLPKAKAVVLCHELELLLYHGHAANKFSVGLEIAGASAWDTDDQVDRAKALLRYFQAVRRAYVGENAKCFVMAHRQSHASRGKDPGKPIWRDVGEWAIEELGFEIGPVVGTGRSIDDWRK